MYDGMKTTSLYRGHRFPAAIISLAVPLVFLLPA